MNDMFQWKPKSEFRPHGLLRGGHLQTIIVAKLPQSSIAYRARQHLVATTEGDSLVLHEDCPESWQPGHRCALLVHGLGGCHGSPYVVRMAHKLESRGVRVFRLDMRGCGAGFRVARKPGHAGRSEDIAASVEFISRECGGAALVVAGFSLGANLVLKWLGECGSAVPSNVVRAITVAPPVDLYHCSRNIERPAMYLYNRWFVRLLLDQLRLRREFMPDLASVTLTRFPRSLLEFDDRVTAPLSGFSGAREYYERSSSAQFLNDIRVSTLILAAADDPIVPASMFRSLQVSPAVALHVAVSGGHVGFFGVMNGDPDRYWLDWRVVEFVCE